MLRFQKKPLACDKMLRDIEINNLRKMDELIFLSDKAKKDDDAISALGEQQACLPAKAGLFNEV